MISDMPYPGSFNKDELLQIALLWGQYDDIENETARIDKVRWHTDHPAGGFVHLLIEYLVWTGRFQVQITVYLEKMNHNFNNCLLLSAGACAQRGRFKI